jgi:protein dithiol:quinone oxidoreductase
MNLIFNHPRSTFATIALICASFIGYALYLQHFEYQDPCPLCLVQRGCYIIIMFAAIAAALHGKRFNVYGWVAAAGALTGAGTAARQVWLQHLPKDEVPACGPDLYYMIDNFPLTKMLGLLFKGSGQCAEVTWRFLGLSIAEWSLLWFVLFATLALLFALRRKAG